MTEDIGEMWREHKEFRQQKRRENRASSAQLLRDEGIRFESKNMDAHLIVDSGSGKIDFWPGTGLWIPRGDTKRRRGVRELIKFIENE